MLVDKEIQYFIQAESWPSLVLSRDVIGLDFIALQSPSARPPTGDACCGRAVCGIF